jgi:hypothetical protein
MKRGQITVFIIVGMVVLAVGFAIFFIGNSQTEKIAAEVTLDTQPESVKQFVQSCLDNTLEDAIVHIGDRGGYIYLPDQSTKDALLNAPYYFQNNDLYVPLFSDVENQIEQYVEQFLPFCLQKFSSFSFQVDADQPNVKILATSARVSADLILPLQIHHGDKVTNLESFSTTENSRILQMHEAASRIIADTKEFAPSLCLTCADEVIQEYNFQIDLIKSARDEVFYVITDEENKIAGEPTTYRFAVKYDLK